MTITKLFDLIGEDKAREGLKDTPKRVEKFYQEFFTGYNKNPLELLSKSCMDSNGYEHAIIIKDIAVQSFCEHHLLPMHGMAHIAYIPNSKIVGIGKFAEIVEIFARRLQLQERLTEEIGNALTIGLQAKAVAVVMELEHFCMKMRSANAMHSKLKTEYYSGMYKSDLKLRNTLKF